MLKTYEIKENFKQLVTKAVITKDIEGLKKAKEFYLENYFFLIEIEEISNPVKTLFNELDNWLNGVFTSMCYTVAIENKDRNFAEAFYTIFNMFLCDDYLQAKAKYVVNLKIKEFKQA